MEITRILYWHLYAGVLLGGDRPCLPQHVLRRRGALQPAPLAHTLPRYVTVTLHVSRVTTTLVTEVAEYVFLCLFLTEMFVRIYALGPRIYFESSFNRWFTVLIDIYLPKICVSRFDCAVICASVFEMIYTEIRWEQKTDRYKNSNIYLHLQEVYLQRCQVFFNLKH